MSETEKNELVQQIKLATKKLQPSTNVAHEVKDSAKNPHGDIARGEVKNLNTPHRVLPVVGLSSDETLTEWERDLFRKYIRSK